MIGRKMESCEPFISRLVDPVNQCWLVGFDVYVILSGVFIDCFEAARVVFECCKGQSRVHARFFQDCNIEILSLLRKHHLQLPIVIL